MFILSHKTGLYKFLFVPENRRTNYWPLIILLMIYYSGLFQVIIAYFKNNRNYAEYHLLCLTIPGYNKICKE